MLALKLLLQNKGISQATIARAVNLSPATIAQLLNKHIWPSEPDQETLTERLTTALQKHGLELAPSHLKPVSVAPPTETGNPTLTNEVFNMLLRKQTLTPAARKHFSLFRDPFDNDVNSGEDVFSSPNIRHIREELLSIAKFVGFMAIIWCW